MTFPANPSDLPGLISSPGNDPVSEQMVLGSLLQHNHRRHSVAALVLKTASILAPSDFHDERHAAIFGAMVELAEARVNVDIDTIFTHAKAKLTGPLWKDLWPTADDMRLFLRHYSDLRFTSENLEYYANAVKKQSRLRSLVALCDTINAQSHREDANPDDLVADLMRRLMPLQAGQSDTCQTLSSAVNEVLEDTKRRIRGEGKGDGITTGFFDVDYYFGAPGMVRGDLVVLAARPSVGKTGLAVAMGINAAKTGRRVLMFSSEMRNLQVAARALSAESRVSSSNMRSGNVSDADLDRLCASAERFSGLPFRIDQKPTITPAYVRAACQQTVVDGGLDLVIIDYLQLMSAGKSNLDANRNLEVAYISRSLKAIANEFRVPVLVLSQLSRAVEKRENKRPILSDLRDSGAVEQDADVVVFLHREEYAGDKAQTVAASGASETQVVELIFRKNRMGETGSTNLHFTPAFVRFDAPFDDAPGGANHGRNGF
jgi:replicative DNA helicase